MLRHMKAHLKDTTASGQTYSCSICDKVFSRADTRKRHEAAHSYSLTCEVCATGFYMGILGGGDTVHRCFVTGPGLGATGHFIGDLCLASDLSCWARWRASLSSLLKY
jgi:hypothetical protein